MKHFVPCILLAALLGCSEGEQTAKKAAPPAGDAAAGKLLAERECKGCHGLDGRSAAPAIPHLAAQRESYLLASLRAYREKKRAHAALKEIVAQMSDADARNLAAFYSGLPPVTAPAGEAKAVSPYERGKALAGACVKCHGADADNPALPVPKISGQDRDYLVMALRAYRDDRRESSTMHKMSLPYGDAVIDSIASYYAAQPAR
jgi:cytochrome c553